MRKTKLALLSGAAPIALALGMLSSPALAFDEVNWTWDNTVTSEVNSVINIDATIEPTGLVEIEKLQTQIGDVTATSTVSGITNNQPGVDENGNTIVDLGTLEFTGNRSPVDGNVTGSTVFSNEDIDGGSFLAGNANTGDPFGVTMNFDLGEITVEPGDISGGGPLDAVTELPEVVSAATAVGNNQQIVSSVGVFLHDEQIVEAESISATSTVFDILNATVDSAATAVGNNLTVEIAAGTPGDAFLIADVTQMNVASVSASSSVSDVTLSNYTNLGNLSRPIVNSVATAVGNNASFTLSPAVVVAP